MKKWSSMMGAVLAAAMAASLTPAAAWRQGQGRR